MDILFKPTVGKSGNMVFRCYQNDVSNFCAGDLIHNFLVEKEASQRHKGSSWGLGTQNEKPVKQQDLLKAILEYGIASTMFVMADVKDGCADKWLFGSFDGKPFTMKHPICKNNELMKVTAQVSDYYFNRNSGNLVRHASVVTEIVDAKTGKSVHEKRRTKEAIALPPLEAVSLNL